MYFQGIDIKIVLFSYEQQAVQNSRWKRKYNYYDSSYISKRCRKTERVDTFLIFRARFNQFIPLRSDLSRPVGFAQSPERHDLQVQLHAFLKVLSSDDQSKRMKHVLESVENGAEQLQQFAEIAPHQYKSE